VVVRAAVLEMHRQVGPLAIGGDGLARRGLLVRHLLMPGALDDAEQIFRWLAEAVSPETYVNVMDQYRPEGAVLRAPEKYPELARPIEPLEAALARARRAGLSRFDVRRPHPRLRRLALT
jgi:putative pyruvate formate lyase activating enzyme